jgi:hypothetical protein
MRVRPVLVPLALLAFLPWPGTAQQADPADVSSQDAIVAALYDVISGPAGQERDWDRFRSLFIPENARLVATGVGPQGNPGYNVFTPDGYREAASGALLQGFFEVELGRVTEEFGNVAHVFSSYASRRADDDPEPFQRGINSIQLFHDGSRWWIVSVMWDSERPGNPIPDRYLGG